MPLQPFFPHGRYLYCQLKSSRENSTVIIPMNAETTAPYGEVLAIGPEVTTVKVGDKVIFAPGAIIPLPFGTEKDKIFLLAEGSVLGHIP